MKLKRLEIFGFKSFAKKLDLKLVGGITSVVGPNGCGKTNVIDAIRWVLGEQRPTMIRLERMEDVLFKGSDSRRPLGMAEVSLTIDNDARLLHLDIPEITITRRLFRTGESDYMINHKACRLADINELFMDTGMGTDSYSMFEQDMINSILSDKTEDRRHIFEEAAGVTKYKARRRSAVIKLSSIEDDLDRVGDIIYELERYVGSLKRQASKAERYRKLKTEIKERTVTIAACEIEQLRAAEAKSERDLKSVQAVSESVRVKSAKFTTESEQLSVDILHVEKELDEIAGVFNANLLAINEREKELVRLGSQLEYLGEKAEHTREESRRAAEELEILAESHGNTGNELKMVTARFAEVLQASGEQIGLNREHENLVRGKGGAYNTLEQEYRRVEREQAEKRASLETVRLWGESGKTRLEEINKRSGELESAIAEAEKKREHINNEKQRAYELKNVITGRIAEMKEALEKKVALYNEADNRFRSIREQEASLRAEYDFLSKIVHTCEGYSEGVRNAVGSEALDGGVFGVLGDMVAADEKYLKAVETAFEDRLQNVLVDSEETALAGVRFLLEDAHGRAAFLPVKTAGSADVNNALPEGQGIIGSVCDIVRADARFEPVIRRLFADVVVVDTLERALELHHRTKGITFVTLTGEKVGFQGDIRGGNIKEDESRTNIGRMERLENLASELDKTAAEIEAHADKRETISKEADYLRASIREKELNLEDNRNESQVMESDGARISAKKEADTEMLSNITDEKNRIIGSFNGFESEIETLGKDISSKGAELKELGELLHKAAEELESLRAGLDKRRKELNDYSIERAALSEKRASLDREIGAIKDRREALAQSSARMIEDIDNIERESLDVGSKKSEIIEELEKLSVGHEQIKTGKDETELRHAELASRRSEIERELQNIRRELVECSQKESEHTLKRDQAVMHIKTLIERIEDEYFVNREEIKLPENDPDFDPEQERLLLEDLRRKIQAVGDVNMAAEKDYKEEKKRLDFLKGERDDLVEARKTLSETINKINLIARQRFLDTFGQIQLNFQSTFQNFFDGGVCCLELEQDDDPLEAKILISARPHRNNVRSINRLSSREKALSAISLLFSIYQVKPSPCCILDEVDAPFDDANLDRYLSVIRSFSKTTQFIMVTHNKKTMAAADNLYGITMGEPGLSNLVSVRLSQVDSFTVSKSTERKDEVSEEKQEVS